MSCWRILEDRRRASGHIGRRLCLVAYIPRLLNHTVPPPQDNVKKALKKTLCDPDTRHRRFSKRGRHATPTLLTLPVNQWIHDFSQILPVQGWSGVRSLAFNHEKDFNVIVSSSSAGPVSSALSEAFRLVNSSISVVSRVHKETGHESVCTMIGRLLLLRMA